jgi:alpha-beta hydrolase superfamily lysophospholipase
MRLFYYVLGFVGAAYLVSAMALFLMQDRMLLPRTPAAPNLQTVAHPSESVDLWQIRGDYAGYVVTPQDRPVRGTVMVFHGNQESAETKLPLANVFTQIGYRVVILEYPGHGRRPGPRKMQAALAASREAFAQTRAQWPGPVYVVGESLGAGMASQVVSGHETAIAGVLLLTPWDSLDDVAAQHYPIFPVRWMIHSPFDSVAAVSRYKGPLVIVGAKKDTLIPVAHARRFAREHPSSSLVILPTANHDNWFDVMTRTQWDQVLGLMKIPKGTAS